MKLFVQIDFLKNGSIHIKAGSLAIKRAGMDNIEVGGGMLSDIDIYVQQEKNGLIPSVSLEKSQVDIRIGSVVGTQIVYHSDAGPIKAQSVQLSNLSLSANGEDSPFSEMAQGSSTFSVDSASVHGLDTSFVQASSISVGSVKGNMTQDGGQISTASATAMGLGYDGTTSGRADL